MYLKEMKLMRYIFSCEIIKRTYVSTQFIVQMKRNGTCENVVDQFQENNQSEPMPTVFELLESTGAVEHGDKL